MGFCTKLWLNVPTFWTNIGTYTHYTAQKPKKEDPLSAQYMFVRNK